VDMIPADNAERAASVLVEKLLAENIL